MVAPVPGGIGRYTEDLTRQLIATAPRDCEVEGIVSASPPHVQDELRQRLPGLAGLHVTPLARRELLRAWQLGLTTLGGMVHAPSLLAPLRTHDPENDGMQVVVTIRSEERR